LLLISFFIIISSGCNDGKVYRIGVSQCSRDDWRSKMNDEINREIMFHPGATVEIRSADDNNGKQIADLRYFADNGFDIVIVAPNEADAITPVVKEIYERGIPVIVFDRNINGDTYTARIGVDDEGIGRSAARYALQMLGTGAKAIEIYGLAGSTPAQGRHEGFAEAFAAGGGSLVGTGYGNWNHDEAAAVADSLLNLYPDVDLIYAHNDRMAIGASEVAARKGLDNIKIIGIDAAPSIGIRAVADSVIDATFLYPTEGHRLVRTALAVLKGEPFERNVVIPASSAVDLSNADILLLQNESLNEETSKMRQLKSQVDDYWDKHSAQTTLFYASIAILVLLCGVLFLLLRAFWQRQRHHRVLMEQNRLLEQQRDLEKSLNEQLAAATQSKLVFFTNVSHDLRTPLTLISEPVEQLADADNLTPRQQSMMRIARKNVKILHRLINQILDFRKYENGKLSLNMTEVDFGRQAAEWAESFRDIAAKRGLKFRLDIPQGKPLNIAIDVEKIERVFFNLMSNAIKYNRPNGSITFTCDSDGTTLVFTVADTGEGISAEDLGNIFERFYQVDRVHPNGSGIGLSLAKAFAELHGGDITVESEPGRGTVFTVELPVTHVADEAAETAPCGITEGDVMAELDEVEVPVESSDDSRPLLLVIDDNADILKLVTTILGDEYRTITASNGKEGLRMAAKYTPDLIICDVMMPVMDGLECCRMIKSEVSTSHIPVLMLTACSRDEQRVQGYDSGADGYVSKPFNNAVLRSRCRSLIENRMRVKQLWASQGTEIKNSEDNEEPRTQSRPVGEIDNEFYNRFLGHFKEVMSDPDASVDLLAGKLGLGRSQFYRKIKALTNYSPVELMRRLRLKQARHLLATTEKNISEIAYEVGFSSPAYFSKCYREAFNETPTELRERLAAK
ncbi:MAG: substrate-binding domain-containing protein, partial [Duncaniella sp.]|nr:substrate-binding domain-containing protein [Duncaniella sp.]